MSERRNRLGSWRAGAALSTLAAAALLTGCVSAEPADRPPPKQPSWAKTTDVFVSSGFPEDTDGNAYLDTMAVTMYLFDGQFPGASIRVPGSVSFVLMTSEGSPLGRWDLTEQQTAASARPMPPGPGYVFKLSLLDHGTDKLDSRVAELAATFTPTGGKPVRAKVLTITLGRTGLRPPGSP